MSDTTRQELEERARELRTGPAPGSNAQELENALVRDIRAYEQAHPIDIDEMGIAAGDPAQGPEHKICVSKEDIDELVDALRTHKRVALSGSPAFGRVYAAQELGYILMGSENPEHLAVVEFNESYSFLDFMGFPSPVETFVQRGGLFWRMCEAASRSTDPFVLVINETFVGKINEIFAELDTLITSEAGQEALKVLYGAKEPFAVPDNVYILALTPETVVYSTPPHSFVERTLNASMDISELIAEAQAADLHELREALNMVEAINSVVTASSVLGDSFVISQNFVCPCTLRGGDDVLAFTVKKDLDPLIVEYSNLWASMWSFERIQNV